MLTIDTAERRRRVGLRHHLARPASDVDTIAADLVGLHSSDAATVYLSAWARVDGFQVPALEEALYERRSVVRMLGMRRTMFVVTRDVAAVMDAACTRALVDGERRRLIGMVEKEGITDDGADWVDKVRERTCAALALRGEATAAELTEHVEELGLKLSFGEGTKWAGTVGVSTRVLFLLATEGRIVRGRPRGTWVSTQYRWALTPTWLGGELPHLHAETARAELARSWLGRFGPGTEGDLAWWCKWTKRHTGAALAAVGAVEVDMGGAAGYLLPDDLEPTSPQEPWVALLPSLDSTVMGWKERAWFFGDHAGALFDRNGNAGPTVWVDGRIVGGWAQRPTGEILVRLLEPVGSETRTMIDAEAHRLQSWLGDTVVIPRFRTPLEKELAAGR